MIAPPSRTRIPCHLGGGFFLPVHFSLRFRPRRDRMCAMDKKRKLSRFLKRAACWGLLIVFSPVIAVCYVSGLLVKSIDIDMSEEGEDAED